MLNSSRRQTRINSSFLIKMLALQFAFVVIVLLNIPFARQIFGFFYLTFLPGFLLLKLLRLEKASRLETILFSEGLGIAFLMIVGLMLNEFGLLVGVSTPLSEASLMIVLNIVVFLLYILGSGSNQEFEFSIVKSIKSIVNTPLAILFVCLPFLSVLGVVWMNTYENNTLLLFLIIAVSILLVAGSISKRLLNPKFYPLVLLMIAISLLLHRSLITDLAQSGGSDVYLELSVFKITKNALFWNPTLEQFAAGPITRYNNMLSITVLPTIFSNLMNMDPTWIVKIVYPLLFSFVPLALYHLWKNQIGPKMALISSFLFMAQQTFYMEMLGLTRQMIAELFFVLLLILIINPNMKASKKIVLFAVFCTALTVSHYAMSIIFLFFVSFWWIFSFLLGRRRVEHARNLTLVVLFSVVMFSWYIYTSNATTFNSILEISDNVYNELGEFANPLSRGTTVLRGIGLEAAPSILNSISRGIAYIIQLFMVIGFLGLVTGRLKSNLKRDYLTFNLLAMFLLAALILVPGLAETLNMTRFYHVLLFFLAPLAALGAEFLIKSIFKRNIRMEAVLLLLAVLIPYFLFQTNFIYEVSGGDSWSLPLSYHRMNTLRLYGQFTFIDAQSASGASWLATNLDVKGASIHADWQAQAGALTYYGITYESYLEALSNVSIVGENETVYLNRLNVIDGKVVSRYYLWNFSELTFLKNLDLVYANGGCEIYRNP